MQKTPLQSFQNLEEISVPQDATFRINPDKDDDEHYLVGQCNLRDAVIRALQENFEPVHSHKKPIRLRRVELTQETVNPGDPQLPFSISEPMLLQVCDLWIDGVQPLPRVSMPDGSLVTVRESSSGFITPYMLGIEISDKVFSVLLAEPPKRTHQVIRPAPSVPARPRAQEETHGDDKRIRLRLLRERASLRKS